ncbi:MAG: nitrile hydratase subunit beta [Alphaproteobacteria bacterium]|nr:nitrile hydratase subunit beta [Alphaproteobacteria bacterium]
MTAAGVSARFTEGDRVRVRAAYPPGHMRTPFFIRGHVGTVIRFVGTYANPEELAYGRDGKPKQPLYWVSFPQSDLWQDYSGSPKDTTIVDVFESWLDPLDAGEAS